MQSGHEWHGKHPETWGHNKNTLAGDIKQDLGTGKKS